MFDSPYRFILVNLCSSEFFFYYTFVFSLQACPAKTYSVECSICLSSFREGHAAAVLFCGHVFHPNCELHWRKYSILNNYVRLFACLNKVELLLNFNQNTCFQDHSTCATCRARYTVASVRQIQLHFGACEGCELKDNKLENLRSQLDVLQSENRQLREFLTAATTATTTAAADSITSSVAPQTIEVKKIQQIIRSKKSHRRNWKQRKDQSAV